MIRIITSLIILIAIFFVVILLVQQKKPLQLRISKKLFVKHKIALFSACLVLIASFTGGVLLFTESSEDKTLSKVSVVPSEVGNLKPTIEASKSLPAYEIVQKSAIPGSATRIVVFVTDKDKTKLENLNKKLLTENSKDKNSPLNIHYFTSKAIAKIYFDKIVDSKVTKDDKKALFKAYLATSGSSAPFDKKLVFLGDPESIKNNLTANKNIKAEQ